VHWAPYVPKVPLSLPLALVTAHLLANLVWIGALLAVCLLVGAAPLRADPTDTGSLARRVHVRLAMPAFLASLGTGVWRIALEPAGYAHMPWLHAKLGFVLAIIIVHHTIGSRAKRVADGRVRAAQGVTTLGAVVFICAGAAVFLVISRWP
jgi:putative membrane protein